ncbi:uncharacterized protein L969DRAFT_18261 [Mixia osmundae IAM 14324]|nr:uncharacterized protein L969DRAFT_18261 [Mixia osmundae IAM 14324]KEI38237.1 hypothetical protein L969DRAFT_18261 [Mixia osmundae IAM 14324]
MRRTPPTLLSCCARALATASSAPIASTSAPPASSATEASYTRALPSGKLRVYDEALKVISKDRQIKLERLERLPNDATAEQREELEVLASVNDPETRWQFSQGLGDPSSSVMRHLAEQDWRTQGSLARLMQRVLQMDVVPDLLPAIDPEVDLNLYLSGSSVAVVPGIKITADQTEQEPELRATVFHPDERLYTLLLIDPDYPDHLRKGFTTFVHQLIANVKISASTRRSALTGDTVLSYIPPHPQKGTPHHRYTYLLFAQRGKIQDEVKASNDQTPGRSAPVELAKLKQLQRLGLSVRTLMDQHNLEPVGVHFVRQQWTPEVTDIFRRTFGRPEPVYGKEKQVDPYKIMRPTSKYSIL